MTEINSIDDCLVLLGSEKPFREQRTENPFDDCLTDSGYIAYDKLRALLFFLSQEKIISSFNEDILDRYIDYNY